VAEGDVGIIKRTLEIFIVCDDIGFGFIDVVTPRGVEILRAGRAVLRVVQTAGALDRVIAAFQRRRYGILMFLVMLVIHSFYSLLMLALHDPEGCTSQDHA
jgi:hypothetical protein